MRNKDQHKGLAKIFYKVKYSLSGLIYFYKNEASAIIFTLLTILLVSLGLYFQISYLEWILLLLSLGLVLVIELLNTAQEITVDMITKEYNTLAKYAKDLGSAATFIASLVATIVACSIFVPKIIGLFI